MRLLIAPDAFKGSLDASSVARAIARGLSRALPDAELRCLPMADGGEGTLEAAHPEGLEETTVSGPFGEPLAAAWGWLDDTHALIESAHAVGLHLAPRLDPTRASSAGVGQLIGAAVEAGATRVTIALGGSCTVDGGAGLLSALGARLLDAAERPLPPGGGALGELRRVDLEPLRARLRGVDLTALVDIQGPLLGPRGARLYMRQKGADEETRAHLEAGLRHLVTQLEGERAAALPGAGAAGGLGFALAHVGAELTPGADWLCDHLDLDAHLSWADVLLTGEGQLDAQTREGKLIATLARRAEAAGCPAVALCGAVQASHEGCVAMGLRGALSIAPGPITLERAQEDAEALLEEQAAQLGGLLTALSSPSPGSGPG